ncbi:hypothetical protein PISMIDRAFT_678671 [Pisolithus microcarpus 441]|uniref:3'-5' exonuclease domain-containing protein n=1 Tax=Pisolithus microcarpus 441 TaxID=765257 RepID=A0A0C9ZDE3_9AGAM|nr:hypothetical protein BKA83DRAFT_678671 [Pisolithus microcarpus]KIK23949.1 hypothetical protein PISMIDRAFT_678671 [Pisolithus microcarpus 441]
MTDAESDWSIEIYEGVCLPNKDADLKRSDKPRTTQESDASHKRNIARPPHPFFQTYRTQAVGLVQVEASSSSSKEHGWDPVPPNQRHCRKNTVKPTLAHFAMGFSTVATEGNKDRSRPRPPPPRAFKLADKMNTNPGTASQTTSTEQEGRQIPEESHDSSPRTKAPLIKKPTEETSAVEPVLPPAAGNLNGAKSSTTPTYSYLDYRNPPAAVCYTQCEDEANDLVQSLESPLGFDMEWRVMWQAGAAERRTALVQLCDVRTILLIQVSDMKRFPRKVLEVIESPNIVKTGANIKKDGEKLYRDFGIRARGLVELGGLAAKADDKFKTLYNREVVSLAKMVSLYLGKTLIKNSVRTSNWEAKLTSKMVDYAANDCHCAVMVYNKLAEKASQEGKHLEVLAYSCDVDPRTVKLSVGSHTTALEKSSSTRSSVTRPPSFRDYCIPEPASPQCLRAYKMWYERKMPLDKMCSELKTGGRIAPLKESTVISYVIGALQADALLPFDLRELRELVQMEAGSWQRHRAWIHERERRTLTI